MLSQYERVVCLTRQELLAMDTPTLRAAAIALGVERHYSGRQAVYERIRMAQMRADIFQRVIHLRLGYDWAPGFPERGA